MKFGEHGLLAGLTKVVGSKAVATGIVGTVATVLTVGAVGVGVATYNGGIRQTGDAITHEAGKKFSFEVSDYFSAGKDVLAEMSVDTSGVNKDVVGNYEILVTYRSHEYTVGVEVVDTTAPKVEFVNRYILTNNVAELDASSMIKKIVDASACETKLIRFERSDNLSEMEEDALKALENKIPLPSKAEELLALGTEEIPSKEGVYRSVVEIKDACGNVSYEEIYVVLDTTGARIEEVEDLVVEVEKGKLNEEPELDLSLYKAMDNVDGSLSSDDLTLETILRNEENHEWIVKVSYTDRAGNESFGEFLITVKEKENKKDSNRSEDNDNTATEDVPVYDSADTNNDGVVDPEEESANISAEEQACINAGYGVVVSFNGGEWYAVLVHGDGTVNGKSGSEILREYLAQFGLEPTICGGCWISSANDWFWYSADGIREIITEDDPEFWD